MPQSGSDYSLDYVPSDHERVSESDSGSGSDMDIDEPSESPPLRNAAPSTVTDYPLQLHNMDLAHHMDLAQSDDDDFPEPVIFSDASDSGHDDLDDGYTLRDNIKAALGFKVRARPRLKTARRRAMRRSTKDNDPEIRDHLSRANEAFVRQDLATAWKHYTEVIKLDPKNFNAYRTLGEMCQMRGNLNKCCLYWLLAAECGEADDRFWAMVGELSALLGHIDQAVHCFNQAIAKLDGANTEYILQRSLLYKEKRNYGRALEGLQRIFQRHPDDASILKTLAGVYVEQKRLNDAINLYMRVLESNMNPQPGSRYALFGWTELNITLELLASQHSWAPGIKLIKVVARWKQGRRDEAWWDDEDNDSEFDMDRRRDYILAKKPASYNDLMHRDIHLPIDIRFKLGCFRLELDHKDEAILHFEYLKDEQDNVSDLFHEAGKLLEAKCYYAEAIDFLEDRFSCEESPELGFLLGKCHLEVKDYTKAKHVLLTTLKYDPSNVDLKLTLIEALYHTEDMDIATELMEDISKSQIKKPRFTSEEAESADEHPEENDATLKFALIKNAQHLRKIRTASTMTEEERNTLDLEATRMVFNKYTSMQRLQEAIDNGHQAAATAWLKIASQLIEMFMEVRSFFPKNRKTTFKGIVWYKRKKTMGLDDRLARIYNLYDGITESNNSRMEVTAQTEFRGLSYDTWLYVFIQYAYMIKRFENNIEQAIEIIELALEVSVFIQNKTRAMLLRIARLVFGIQQQDYAITVLNNVRYLLTSTQFSPSIYNFFICCFALGISAWAAFSNYNHQKFFLRHVKTYDSLLTDSKVSGSAQVIIDVKDHKFDQESPHLLYIYASLLGSNRTFASPIVYLTRAYRHYYKDPTICFMLGLAHVHRLMQRNSNNRHIQLLQGVSYLMEYKAARSEHATVYEKQEIEYNFGRMFHMIGLPTLAIKHYNQVLAYHEELANDLEYDMLVEAAYNLLLIYTLNGNTAMSQQLIEEYLTV